MPHLRKLLLATVAAAVLVGFVATFASAAGKPNRPVITLVSPTPDEGAVLTSTSLPFSYNRTPKQTNTLTCALSGPNNYFSSAACNAPTAITGGSSSGASYTGLLSGSYTFTVTLTLTDGGTVTATRDFTVPLFAEVSPIAHEYTFGDQWIDPSTPDSGETTAALQPAGGIVIPPTPTASSTSGCTASDFNGFVSGRVALIQRGGCNFGVKVLNAQAAGASGVVIFNEGNPGRTGLQQGSLLDANNVQFTGTIPVAFVPFLTGSDLLNQYNQAVQNNTDLPTMHIDMNS
jgi:PA domain